MHLRVTKRRRGAKLYRSVQIVQSFRRPDGISSTTSSPQTTYSSAKPANQVLCSLGNLSELETQNLKAALAASRRGAMVVPKQIAKRFPSRVQRNLRYLDAAVCYRV